ncbi:helix-turn-helix domain-containing protein, partial [Nocardia cyriacigeorgica]
MKESNSTLPLRELGRQLRDAREGLGMSIERAAGLMEMSASALQRLETGESPRHVRRLTDVTARPGAGLGVERSRRPPSLPVARRRSTGRG